jgi:5-carboxymethyl-2-hydroxymuconate isomerase
MRLINKLFRVIMLSEVLKHAGIRKKSTWCEKYSEAKANRLREVFPFCGSNKNAGLTIEYIL